MTEPRDTYTVAWQDGVVLMIDQQVLPQRFEVLQLTDYRDLADAIRTMAVRGAPAIGVSAALGLALAAREALGTPAEFHARLREAAEVLRGTRPTAVNLFWAIDRVMKVAEQHPDDPEAAAEAVLAEALTMLDEDVRANRAMGEYGAALLPDHGNILTHCNTGSLATVYHGTALGVIRSAVEHGKQLHVWVDETRPRLQGMKLTAWECSQLQIPATVITDNMACWVMRQGRVDAAIVGADRIAANGDTANKIGTYGVAVLARHHGIPFYVAAPFSTIDPAIPDGSAIPIEERDPREVQELAGQRIVPAASPARNPAFDVTPAALITAIVTERGIFRHPYRFAA
jgi:methylthioribose-1-phosphate isomerase